MKDTFLGYGPPELCAWQVEKLGGGKGIFWFQTTDKMFARKLSKRGDTRRVEVTGWNHFRQTYEMRGSWRKVKKNHRSLYFVRRWQLFWVNTTSNCTLSASDCVLNETSAQNAIAVWHEGDDSGEVEDL
jgi:hypothetical protein